MPLTKLHVISGLPRSGSTLLSAILRQNPRFRAAVTSPVVMLCNTLQKKMADATEFSVFFDDPLRKRFLQSVFDVYYADVPPDTVVFDTNRTWTGKAGLLGKLYPECQIICCVRDIGWIIDSIERMLLKNSLRLSRIFNFQPGSSVYTRAELLMNTDNGLVGQALSTLRECWFGEHAKRMLIVQYDSLVSEPERIMRDLYHALGEPYYAHDFDNITYDEPEYDNGLGMPGMHKVRPKIVQEKQMLCIPPDIYARYADLNFWTQPELNMRNVRIL